MVNYELEIFNNHGNKSNQNRRPLRGNWLFSGRRTNQDTQVVNPIQIQMKAIVQVNYRDMKGNEYQVREVVSDRVTLEYKLSGQTILVDFNLSEVQLVINQIYLLRNQAYRDARFVSYTHKKGYVFEYAMPNGKVYRNLIKNPLKP